MACWDNSEEHCCWIRGKPCQYLEENTVPGRRWACGLLRKHGDWESVYATQDYRKNIKPVLDEIGLGQCGEYPGGTVCATCGKKYGELRDN